VVDRDVLEANFVAMANHARDHGLSPRPHAKTHKCVEIARRQLALGAVGLTVATVGEGEVFASAGFSDLFIAYPLWAAGARGTRSRALAQRVTLRVGADSTQGAEVLTRALAGTDAEVMAEIDSGHHRTRVAPALAGEVAVRRGGLRVSGVFTFPGHGYSPGQRARAAAESLGHYARPPARCATPAWRSAPRSPPPSWSRHARTGSRFSSCWRRRHPGPSTADRPTTGQRRPTTTHDRRRTRCE
jgi:D-serine deaminase-like pyridoxal phosphate-dependent protein